MQPVAAGQHRRLHGQRQPDIRPLADGFAEERSRRNADDRKHAVADSDRGAEDVGTAAEAALPVVVADHCVSRHRIVIGIEGPSEQRRHTQRAEVFGRHHAGANLFRLAPIDPRTAGARDSSGRPSDRRTQWTRRAVAGTRIGQQARSLRSDPTETPPAPGLVSMTSPSRIVHRQRAQENAVEQTEDRRVGADSQRQRKDGDCRKARLRCQGADCVTQVLL